MMRCGKLKTGSLFSRRLKFWFYGDVSLILADFGISMAHAQGRGSHGVAMQQQDGALVPDLDNFDHLPRTSYRTAIAMLLGLRQIGLPRWFWPLLVAAILPIFDKIINHRWIGQG